MSIRLDRVASTAGAQLCEARGIILAGAVLLAGCTPTVQVALPDKPIEINLNVKIEHDIRVKIDKELDPLFNKDSGLF